MSSLALPQPRRTGLARLLDRPGQQLMRRTALATLLANMALVATGGAVRLTDSGLGCPTWPHCLIATAHQPTAYHHWIELGNRMLISVLIAIGVATVLVAMRSRPRRTDLVRLSWLLLAAVPLQAVLGGITVLTHLNPWVVMLHFLASMAMVAVATLLVRRSSEGDEPARALTEPLLRTLVYGLAALVGVVLVLGTIVTGSGPHAGDVTAKRNGLDPVLVTQLHADSVFLLVGLTVALVVTFAAVRAPAQVSLAVRWLLGIELAQGVVGYVQYFTKLPSGLVEVHLIGATTIAAGTAWLVYSLRDRGELASAESVVGAERQITTVRA
jgi:cytochrome c oxidase assembly protein subunit 15